MKANEVIEHIFTLPQFKALGWQNKATRALKLILGKSKESLVRYAYIRGDCLYIAVRAPFAAQELKHDSIINSIKNALNTYFKTQNDKFYKSEFSEIKNVKIFVPKYKEPKIFIAQTKPFILDEKATGYFKIHSKEPKLQSIFKEIQKVLKEK